MFKKKVKAQVYSLDQVKTSLLTSQLPHWSLERAPLVQVELFGLWQSQGHTFHKVTISSQLPINARSSAAHVEPYFKDSLQFWNLAQSCDSNADPFDLEPPPQPPGLRIAHILSRVTRSELYTVKICCQ